MHGIIMLGGGAWGGLPSWVVPAWYAVASVVAWSLYASDKRRAREGRWRVKETTLHLVEMPGVRSKVWLHLATLGCDQ